MLKDDKALGMDRPITRRDFMGSSLLASGAALTVDAGARIVPQASADSWTGYGGVGDYASCNGNTAAVRNDAHTIRDGLAERLLADAEDTGEVFDLIIVGGGFSGLAAAFEFVRHAPDKRCLILDNHSVFGGEARQNEFEVDGHQLWGPQGSNGFLPPVGNSTLSDEVWREIGMPNDYEFADEQNAVGGVRAAWDSYDAMFWGEKNIDTGHFFPGVGWVPNIWKDRLTRTPWDEPLRADMLRAFESRERFHKLEGFERWLDSMSYKHYLEQVMGLNPLVTEYMNPILAVSNFGLCADVISAYAAFLLQLPGMRGYAPADSYDFSKVKIMSFPGGNTAYARRIVQHLIPGSIGKDDSFSETALGKINFSFLDSRDQKVRIRLSATTFDVRQKGGYVETAFLKNGRAYRARSKTVVMAVGGWVARRIVSNMAMPIRDAYSKMHHAPVLVVNVALTNWRFLERLGISAGRWYDGFGFFGSVRAPMTLEGATAPYDPSKPIVMTFYVPFLNPGLDIAAQGSAGRAQLLGRSYADFEREIRAHMQRLFSSAGFDARRDIAGIILNRWGHAYVSPQPGFYFGGLNGEGVTAPMQAGQDQIFYGHSELASRMNYRNAIAEGGRAGRQAALSIG